MKLRKLLAVTVAAGLVIASMAGCGSTSNDAASDNATQAPAKKEETKKEDTKKAETPAEVQDVSLKVWVPEELVDWMGGVEQDFAKAHPEFNMTWETAIVGIDESVNNLQTDADAAADVFVFPSGSLGQLTEAGLIYPITYDYDNLAAAHAAGAISACSLDGMLYGVPCSPNSWFMYYDKSMYTEDEVKSLESMMAKDLGADVKNFSCTIGNGWYIEAFFFAAGCTLFGENGLDATSCDWNNAAGKMAGEYLIDLAANPKYVEDQDGIAGSLMKDHKLAALCTGTWGSKDVKEYLGDNYAATKLPTIKIDGKDCQLSNFADYKAWGVKSNTKFPLAAQQFAVYLGSEEVQLSLYNTDGTTPTITALTQNDTIKQDVATCALIQQSEYATPQPYIAQINEYWTPTEALGKGIVNGEITRDNLQESLDTCVESILTKLGK